MATNDKCVDMTSEALRLAIDAIDAARDCLTRGEWADARLRMREAVEDAMIAEKWEAVDRFAR